MKYNAVATRFLKHRVWSQRMFLDRIESGMRNYIGNAKGSCHLETWLWNTLAVLLIQSLQYGFCLGTF